MEILLKRMHAHGGLVAGAATTALRKFRPGCPKAARLLAAGIDDPARDASLACCNALVPYGPAAKVALPSLLTKLRAIRDCKYPHMYRALLVLIGAIGPDAKEAIPLLLAMMKMPDTHPGRAEFYNKWEKAFIRYQIGQLGTPPELVPVIKDILTNSEHSAELSAAMCAAGGLEEGSEEFLPFFYMALQPDFPDTVMASPGYGYSDHFRKENNTSPTLEAIRALRKMKPEKARAAELALYDLVERKKKEHREREADPHRTDYFFKYSVELTVAEAAIEAVHAIVPPHPPVTEFDGLPQSLEP